MRMLAQSVCWQGRRRDRSAINLVWDGGDDDRFVTNFSAMQSISLT